MATMIVELYDALKAGGAPEDKARAAAMALDINSRFDRIESRFDRIESNVESRFDHVDQQFAGIRGELATIASRVTSLDGKVATIDSRLSRVEGEVGMMKWVLSGMAAGIVVQILRSFWPGL